MRGRSKDTTERREERGIQGKRKNKVGRIRKLER